MAYNFSHLMQQKDSIHRVQTSANVLVLNDKQVHNIDIRLITKNRRYYSADIYRRT